MVYLAGQRVIFAGNMRRTLLWLVAVVLVPLLLVQMVVYYGWFRAERKAEYQASVDLARTIAFNVAEFVRDVRRHELILGTAFAAGTVTNEEGQELFRTGLTECPSVNFFAWVAPTGQVAASSDANMIAVDLSDRPYFQQLVAGREWVISDLLEAKVTQAPVAVIARAIRNKTGRLQGVVTAAVDTRKLGALIPDLERLRGGIITVFDHQGSLLYRRPESPMTAEERRARENDPMVKAALQGREATGIFTSPQDGVKRIAARVPVEEIDWVVGVGQSEKDVMAPLLRNFLSVMGLVLIVAAFSFLLALSISRGLIASVRQLREHARAVGAGKLDRQVHIKGVSELRELGEAYNAMVARRSQAEKEIRTLARFPSENPNPVLRISIEQKLLYSNSAAQLLLDTWKCAPGQAVPEEVAAMVKSVLAAEKPSECEVSAGDLVFSLVFAPIAESGYINVYGRDITARKQAEQRLYEASEKLRFLIENSPLGVVEWDRDYHITRWTRASERIFGWTAEEILGKRIDEINWVHEDDREKVNELMTDMLRGKKRHNVNANRNYRKDRAVIHCEWYNSVLWDAHGELQSVLSLVLDVTDRKKAEESLRQTAEELARSNKELEQFAYIASHDLQEPLRMITGYLQLLERRYKGHLDADADEFIRFAADGAIRLQQLINDLLAYSRVGTRGRAFAPTDCQTVLEGVRANLRLALDESGAKLTHDPLPTIKADASQLSQLFQNLLGNAIKFRSTDRPLTVHIGAAEKDGHWLFSVRDNGIGIEPQYAERIFVIFQRLHGRDKYPGTGIGLALCKKIVERHGGQIWVQSQPDAGSTFYFTI